MAASRGDAAAPVPLPSTAPLRRWDEPLDTTLQASVTSLARRVLIAVSASLLLTPVFFYGMRRQKVALYYIGATSAWLIAAVGSIIPIVRYSQGSYSQRSNEAGKDKPTLGLSKSLPGAKGGFANHVPSRHLSQTPATMLTFEVMGSRL